MIKEQTQKKTVVIIGAGLSGLTAANQILKKYSGQVNVLVLEAMDRVGGRTYTINVEGVHYDMGASFIGPTQHNVINLAIQAKNQLIPQYETGKKVMELNKKISIYNSTIPNNVNIFALAQMQWVLIKINRMAKKVPLHDPHNCPLAQYWDSITLQSWIQKNIWSRRVRLMIQAACRVIYGAQLSQLSMLYFLWYVHQSQSFDNLVNIQNGLQQKKLKLGTQQLSIYLKSQVQKKGGKILLKQFVRKILQNKQGCVILTDDQKYLCDYMIIAMPPSNVRKIDFQPTLSPQRKFISEKVFMGSIGKVILRYKEAYWRNKQFSGQVLCDGYDSPITLTYDDTKSNQNGQVVAGLIVFVGGAVYRCWIDRQEQMKQVILEKLAKYFNQPELKNPLSIHYVKWDENNSVNGGPVGCFPPGLLSHIKQLRKPQGRIHWAGTQLATVSTGFMDGAIDSGKRAANQIIERLGRNDQQMIKVQKQFQQKQKIRIKEGFGYTKYIGVKKFFQWW